MLGLIGGRWPTLPIKLTIASVWKNSMQRRFGVDLKDVYAASRAQPHQIDASLIGVYGLEQGMGISIPFDLKSFVSQVEATSRINLKRAQEPK